MPGNFRYPESLPTDRRALTELVNEGLLERRHGSGTYVAKPKVTYESGELVNYLQAMQQRNIATSSQLLEFSEIAASRRLAELLKIEIGEPIHRIDILRLANRVPVILERVFLSLRALPESGGMGFGKKLDLRSHYHRL